MEKSRHVIYYEKNREKRLEYARKYREKNREMLREKKREYRKTNREDLDKACEKYLRTKKGLIKSMYHNQIKASKKSKIKTIDYTFDELEKWVYDQHNFEKLYNDWVSSRYHRRLKPSIDRIEHKKSYNLNNIQLTTSYYNCNIKGTLEAREKTRKEVVQMDNENNEIAIWSSIRLAEKSLGICRSDISKCAKGKIKTAGGFKWEYSKYYII